MTQIMIQSRHWRHVFIQGTTVELARNVAKKYVDQRKTVFDVIRALVAPIKPKI